MEELIINDENKTKKRGSRIEQIKFQKKKLFEQLQQAKLKENQYKNKEALKVWKKIKHTILDENILFSLNDKEFLEKLTSKIITSVDEFKKEEKLDIENLTEDAEIKNE